jgi:hypothetical protein
MLAAIYGVTDIRRIKAQRRTADDHARSLAEQKPDTSLMRHPVRNESGHLRRVAAPRLRRARNRRNEK